MKTKTEIRIDKIVWWIPTRKIRDRVRDKMLLNNYKIIEQEIAEKRLKLKEECRKNGLICVSHGEYLTKLAQYYRKFPNEFMKEMEEFKKGMDSEDLEYLEYFMNQIKYAPDGIDIPYLIFDNSSLKFFSKEQEIVYFNEESIYNYLKKEFVNIDYISLIILYFKSGILYLPEYIISKFKNTVCIDGGGYIGDTAIFFSKYDFSEVYAFEPDIVNFNTAKRNINNYKNKNNIKILNMGIGNENSKLNLQFNDFIDAGSSFKKSISDEDKSYTVDVVKIDDYFKDRKNKIGLIKLDIEGFEEEALIGAEEIIKNDKPVLLVAGYHDWVSFKQMFRIKKWIENLNLGYKIMFRQIGYTEILTWCFICYVE